MYDNRGRPVNLETKRVHRDMIRSHNEVMQVIGVAEPENSTTALETEIQRQYQDYEDGVGGLLLRVGRGLEIGGVWGVNGLRQRILVRLASRKPDGNAILTSFFQLYKRYSNIPFFELYEYERRQRSTAKFFLAGLPTYLAGHGLKYLAYHYYPYLSMRKTPW
jgi:hypothetical protein